MGSRTQWLGLGKSERCSTTGAKNAGILDVLLSECQKERSFVRIILASTSPYRKELLARLGLPFEVVGPGIPEEIGRAHV